MAVRFYWSHFGRKFTTGVIFAILPSSLLHNSPRSRVSRCVCRCVCAAPLQFCGAHACLDYETHVLCLRGACGLRHCDENRTCMQVCKRSAAAACPAPSRGDGRSGLFLSEQMLFANASLLPDSTYVRLFHSECWGFCHSRYLFLDFLDASCQQNE